MNNKLLPLFDNRSNLAQNKSHVILPDVRFGADFHYAWLFLRSYTGSEGTFNSYRREVERLLQWSWLILKKDLKAISREEIEQYLRFCQKPPKDWIGTQKEPRYILKTGERGPNPDWRPFVVSIAKAQRKRGQTPKIKQFSLSQGSIQEIFAILSTFFNFLISEEYLSVNPIALIRQKSKFIRKTQQKAPIRRLSNDEMRAVFKAAEQMAMEDPKKHERTLLMVNLLFGLYLRISELVSSERWTPMMNHFYKDGHDSWWFKTVGKGNKEREIAVSEEVLECLKRWRKFLGLTPLPNPADNHPLIPKIRGTGPMSDTAPVRRIIQSCFDRASDRLKQEGEQESSEHLNIATVHWLRHTGISEDVKHRPREHVRDDAGHSSSVTTDRYIDVELKARHDSAKKKPLVPVD